MKHFYLHWQKVCTLLILCIGTLFTSTLLVGTPVYASGGSTPLPALKLLTIPSTIDAHNCFYATLLGKNFFPGSSTANLSLTSADSTYLGFTLTPATITIGRDGNFETKVTACNLTARVSNIYNYQFVAVDTTSNVTAETAPFTIITPTPQISLASNHVTLFGGCGTVRIFGNKYVASGVYENDAYPVFYTREFEGSYYVYNFLPHQPVQVNVLGGGNVAIAAMVCGLSHGEQFYVTLYDGGGNDIAPVLTVQAD